MFNKMSERRPEKDGEYLVYTASGMYMVLDYSTKTGIFNRSFPIEVKYWAEIPALPEEG